MRPRVLTSVLILMMGLVGAGSVDAAVKGGLYNGFYSTTDDEEGSCSISFRTDDTLTFTKDSGSGPEVAEGTYAEFDLVLFTIWGATVSDGNQEVSGLGILGIVSTLYLYDTNTGHSGTGFMYRVGNATKSNAKTRSGR